MSCKIKIGHKDALLKIQIEGNATWENAVFFLEFIKKYIRRGNNKVLVDLGKCTFLDSTYFGVLAELTDHLKSSENSEFLLANINNKIMKEIRTIGLQKLVNIAESGDIQRFSDIETTESSFDEDFSKLQKAKQILKSHETLLRMSEHNQEEFKDVVKYFKDYIKDLPEDAK